MVNIQSKTNNALKLFLPSGLGAVLYTFIAGFTVFIHQIDAIREYLELPDYIQILPAVLNWLEALLMSTIGEAKTQVLVVGLFWAMVGLGVYIFLHGVSRFLVDLSQGLDERKFFWPKGANRYRPIAEAVERMFFRGFAVIALLVVVAGPLLRTLSGPVFVDFVGPSFPLQLAVWFLAIWGLLHVCIFLMRLAALRPRLFD